ncbi:MULTISPECIES: restriction endonuclease [Bacillus]|nr:MULTISPECIES: restriction endonuclease [Bacillus]AMK71030.1 hypothetical protein AWV81_02200 [Bacillus subtilis subsp. natto]AOR96758.1 hypothetical protein BSBS38_00443 [Bacillus subtilis]API44690.1 hypothetical protein BSR08_20670 [Bacillus subtilis]API96210.1 hypothetical protein BKP58_10130 [Bacillus subtilis]ARI87083.1 hypothetical protein B7470_13835 [Bacillus subtilis]
MSLEFSPSVISHMKDCILELFWSKSDLYDFFRNSGCPRRHMPLKNELVDMKRYQIVDSVFRNLFATPDKGIIHLRNMLETLSQWDYFDPYYFEELNKLDRSKAESYINKLNIIYKDYTHKLKQQKKNKIEQSSISKKTILLEEIHNEYMSLLISKDSNGRIISSQKRGYHFENLIMKIAQREEFDVTEPFKIKGEQIDGAIKYDGEHYLLEGKWNDAATASIDMYHFAHKVEGKMYGRGLFISVNGFSIDSVKSLVSGKSIKTILIDGTDLMYVTEGRITFCDLLDNKIKAAQTAGYIYFDALMQESKVL